MRLRFFKSALYILWGFSVLSWGSNLLAQTSIRELGEQIAAKEAEVKRLEQEAAIYRSGLNRASLQARTLKGELARLDAAIKQINYRLQITRAELEATALRIRVLSSQISETERNIERRKSQLALGLQEIAYVDDRGPLIAILAAPALTEVFDHSIQLINLDNKLRENAEVLKILKNELSEKRTAEAALELKQKSREQDLIAQQEISNMQKRQREELLRQTRNQESQYQRLLAENQKRQREILREIEALESELTRLLLRVTVPARQPGLFIWPVTGGYVTQEYGPTSETGFINDAYSFHNGIDFGHSEGVGTPVKAVMDGTVIATGDLSPYAYGLWIAIDHGNGLTTLYGHLSRRAVSRGAKVKQGSTIGYMGSTGFATGPHLHLTVYATETFKTSERPYGLLPLGASINPRDYLPR
jgi:murein DD-endopeptidase MepM/ murein hydrolase activator NlpD